MRYCTLLSLFLLLAFASGCTGFFVNPTLTSVAVGPSNPSLEQGDTLQLSATGTYDDGSTKNLTSGVTWDSSDESCATVSGSGVLTAATTVSAICTTEITAASGTVTSSAITATVSPGPLQSITLTASTLTPAAGTSLTFTAKGTYGGTSQQQDITASVTWHNDNTTALTVSAGSGSASAASGASGEVAHVFASLGSVSSNTVTITVQ